MYVGDLIRIVLLGMELFKKKDKKFKPPSKTTNDGPICVQYILEKDCCEKI